MLSKNITFTPVSNFTITRFMSSAFLQLYHSLLFFCLSCQSIHPSPSKLSGRSWKDDTVWWRIYITVTKYILNVFLSACCCQTYTVCCGSFCVLLAGSKGYFTDTISDIKKQTMKPHSPFLFRCFCFTWNASWFHKKKKNFLYKESANESLNPVFDQLLTICTLCNSFLWILAGLSSILTQLILTNDLVTSLVLCALWTLFQQSIKWSSLLNTNHKPECILKRACCVFFIGENPSAGSDCGSHCSRSPA